MMARANEDDFLKGRKKSGSEEGQRNEDMK